MAKKKREYPCSLGTNGKCHWGGNKGYSYGFMAGAAEYCRFVDKWVGNLEKCPLVRPESEAI